jgi:hypothetical protein
MKQIKIKQLCVLAHVRYWEDSEVNGIEDIDFYESKGIGKPKMPCSVKLKEEPQGLIYSDHWAWNPIIDVERGIITNWDKGNIANIHYKVCDGCEIEAFDNDGGFLCNNDNDCYCPEFLSPEGDGFGDYIIMNIDKSGKILNWDKNEVYKWAKNQINRNEAD